MENKNPAWVVSFLTHPFINRSAVAKEIGISPNLLTLKLHNVKSNARHSGSYFNKSELEKLRIVKDEFILFLKNNPT